MRYPIGMRSNRYMVEICMRKTEVACVYQVVSRYQLAHRYKYNTDVNEVACWDKLATRC